MCFGFNNNYPVAGARSRCGYNGYPVAGAGFNGFGPRNNFSLIVVLFILLIIIGCSCFKDR